MCDRHYKALMFFTDSEIVYNVHARRISDVVVQWCSQGDLLAVAGMERLVMTSDPTQATRNAIVKFYNVRGEHIYSLETPAQVSVWALTTK